MTAAVGHNSAAGNRLRAFVERLERLDEEIKALNGDKRDVYAEAKSCGYDVPTIRKLIRRRATDAAALQEQDALLELYERAVQGDINGAQPA